MDLTTQSKARRILSSLAIAATSKMEIAGPMAVHYIMNEKAEYCSHEVSTVPLGYFYRLLFGSVEETEVALQRSSQNSYRVRPVEQDVKERHSSLGEVCLYNLYSNYEKVPTRGKTRDSRRNTVKKGACLLYTSPSPRDRG